MPPRRCKNSIGDTAAFRVGETTWGVQFHPEMSDPILRAVIEAKRSLGKTHTQAITDPPRPGHPEVGRTILGNFLENVRLDDRSKRASERAGQGPEADHSRDDRRNH